MKKARWVKFSDYSPEKQKFILRSMMVAFNPKRKLKEVHITKDYDHKDFATYKIWEDEEGYEFGEICGVRFINSKKRRPKWK